MIATFNSADEIIRFVTDVFGEDLEAVRAIREIDRGHDYQWTFVIGRCDICGKTDQYCVIPTCGDVHGMECASCGNMSVYPDESDDETCDDYDEYPIEDDDYEFDEEEIFDDGAGNF